MTTTLAQLMIARSQVVIRTGVYAEWGVDGVSVEGLQDTSILRAAGEIVSALEASAEEARVMVAKGGSISGATSLADPLWANLLGEDFFELVRDPATRTAGKFRVAASATAASTTIGTGKLVLRSPAGVLFENIEAFAPVPGSAVLVKVRAQVAGTSGNIGNNTTLALVTAYPGLTVTNPPLAGLTSWITTRGTNAESQSAYGARMRARWADLGPQTTQERFASLVRAAYTSQGLAPVVTRVWPDDSNPLGPGSVAVYLATDTAPADPADVALVQAYLAPRWASGAGRLQCYTATIYAIPVVGTIKGPTVATVASQQAAAALATLQASYPIGGATAYLEARRSALLVGVTGAVNVTLSGQDEAIPPGRIVEFSPITLEIVP